MSIKIEALVRFSRICIAIYKQQLQEYKYVNFELKQIN